ncbi:MAG: hypothetical protein ACJAZO_002135 [Myxococcota bacterium]
MIRSLLFASTTLLLSCTGSSSLRCLDNGDCEGIAVCNEVGLCEAVECTQPDQCNLGFTCNDANSCVVGCSGDGDCLAGETCNATNQCEPYGCRSTTLDCSYGERCDVATGQCFVDSAPHCQAECTVDFFGDSCAAQSPGAACACFEDNGVACTESYCLVECNPASADACPRGYQCGQIFQDNPSSFCFADCPTISQF